MNVLDSFRKITTFIFDMDGVLTDGTVLVLDNGLQARKMHIRDGFALQMAVKNAYRVLIVSGGTSPQVSERLYRLGITEVHMQVADKRQFITAYMEKNELPSEQVLYMGDDLPDLPVMNCVGLPSCPSDAAPEIRAAVKYISPYSGGQTCARDVIEKVLKLNDRWQFREDVPSI